MTVIDPSRPTSGLPRLGNWFDALTATVLNWNDARRTRNALSRLSDRQLADIGFVRGDIDEVASPRRPR